MKKTLLVLALIFNSILTMGQESKEYGDQVFKKDMEDFKKQLKQETEYLLKKPTPKRKIIDKYDNGNPVLQTSSPDYKTYYNSAITFLTNGDYENAIKSINKSIILNPNNSDSYYIRGNIFQKQQKNIDALNNYQKAIKLKSNHTDAILKCGIIYGKMNDKITACKYFKKACDLGSTDGCSGFSRFCN